jgi:hypothetical protein
MENISISLEKQFEIAALVAAGTRVSKEVSQDALAVLYVELLQHHLRYHAFMSALIVQKAKEGTL